MNFYSLQINFIMIMIIAIIIIKKKKNLKKIIIIIINKNNSANKSTIKFDFTVKTPAMRNLMAF